MYTILLSLCVLCAKTIASDSDEAKYIDLLPEAEKQEFLNRIARRILEEIQSKDSPEQVQAEVTDEQLNAHNAYVEDLLKEESVNLRNEREISEKADEQSVNEDLQTKPLDQDKRSDDSNISENNDNKSHIDLTLRDGKELGNKRRLNENPNLNENGDTNDSTFSVIPVKVIYDEDNVENVHTNSSRYVDSTTNTSIISSVNNREQNHNIPVENSDQKNNNENGKIKSKIEVHKTNFEHKTHLDQNNRTIYKDNNTKTVDSSTVLPDDKIEEIVTSKDPEVIHNDSNNFQIIEQSKNTSNDQELITKTKNIQHVKENDTINVNSVTGNSVKNIKNNSSKELISSSITGNKKSTTVENVKGSNVEVINEQPLVSTTERVHTDSNHIDISKEAVSTSLLPDISTIKGLTINPNTKEHKGFLNNNANENVENDKPQKYYRKKLKILSKDYSFEVESYKKNDGQNDSGHDNLSDDLNNNLNDNYSENHNDNLNDIQSDNQNDNQSDNHNYNQNNAVNRYFVYEIPDDKPVYTSIQNADRNDHQQPYYVPIYNFAPKNAYYNAYNHLGPNDGDSDRDTFGRSSNHDKDVFDKDIYTRDGFNIDLGTIGGYKKLKYKFPAGKIPPKPRHDVIRDVIGPRKLEAGPGRVKTEPYIDIDYYFGDDDGRRQYGDFRGEEGRWNQYLMGQRSVQSTVEKMPDLNIDRNVEKLVYGTLRRENNAYDNDRDIRRRGHKKKKHNVRELPNSDEEDHPYYSIYKSNMKDHVRAVRKLLFKQKKFGFPDSSPYLSRYKRMLDRTHALVNKGNLILASNNAISPKVPTNNFAWDYYWGKLKNKNMTSDFEDIDEIEDKTARSWTTKNKDELTKGSTISKIQVIRSETDGMGNLEANVDAELDALTNVLKDLIRRDNKYLVSYNWLLTTIEINGAINKLLHLIEDVQDGNHIHPLDSDLLNYVLHLYNSSNNIVKYISKSKLNKYNINITGTMNTSTKTNACLLARMRILPKTKRRKPGEKLKNPLNLWTAWNTYYNRVLVDNSTPVNNAGLLSNLRDVLVDLQDSLYELHSAIKRIATITTYENQNWYDDLKNIFLKSASRRQLLQILLHLGTAKLVDSIEQSIKKKEHYVIYIKNNKEEMRRIEEDFMFVLRILERLNWEIAKQFIRECNI